MFISADFFIYGDGQGRSYQGSIGKTAENATCISWNDPRLAQYGYKAEHFPDTRIPGPYCRNPRDPDTSAYASGPWCYVDGPADVPKFSICSNLMQTGK